MCRRCATGPIYPHALAALTTNGANLLRLYFVFLKILVKYFFSVLGLKFLFLPTSILICIIDGRDEAKHFNGWEPNIYLFIYFFFL
jgi:uncharacterized membrane protein